MASFPYGEGPGLEFVDSFHTGYVLECLCDLREADPGVDAAVAAGFEYYQDRFFDAHGRALLWPSKAFPEDAHSAGTGLSTLARLARAGVADTSLLARVADRAAADMCAVRPRDPPPLPLGPTRVRYVRWADAHMALGLAARRGGPGRSALTGDPAVAGQHRRHRQQVARGHAGAVAAAGGQQLGRRRRTPGRAGA